MAVTPMQTVTTVSGERPNTQSSPRGGQAAAATQTANATAFNPTCTLLTSEPAPPKQPQSMPSPAMRSSRTVTRQNAPYASAAASAVGVPGSRSAAAPTATSASARARTPISGAGRPAVDREACAMYGEAIFQAPAITSRIAEAANAG